MLTLAGCHGHMGEAIVFPDRLSLHQLGLPQGLATVEEWHLQHDEERWKVEWSLQCFDSAGYLVEKKRTHDRLPHTHTVFTLDTLKRVIRVDLRVQQGQVGGFQRYHYDGDRVECQHFNVAGHLMRRVRMQYAGEDLVRRQEWLFDKVAKPAQQHLDMQWRTSPDGTRWCSQYVDGQLRSRQARQGVNTMLVRYDDSAHVESVALSSAQSEWQQDRKEGSEFFARTVPAQSGTARLAVYRAADGGKRWTEETFDPSGQPRLEKVVVDALGNAQTSLRRYRYVFNTEGVWIFKVALQDGQAVECWSRQFESW
jgi:hypothetical protein